MSLLFRLTIDSRMRLVVFASALVWLWPVVAGAQFDDPTITVCNDCSSGFQYSHAAVQAAEFEFDDAFLGGSDDVYVVNIAASQTLAYRVTRTMIDPDPTFFGDETLETTATPIDGEPALMLELADALQAIMDFHEAVIQDIPAEELNLPFDSALDLIGGSEGSMADFYRRDLENALRERFASFETTLLLAAEGFSRVVSGVIFGEASFGGVGDGDVLITFPDGSSLWVQVDTVNDLSSSEGFSFRVDADTGSITVPGMRTVPIAAAELEGLEFTTPDPGLSQEFQDLLRRLGADVEDPPPGGGDPGICTTTTCVSAGVDDNGVPIFRCTTSISNC